MTIILRNLFPTRLGQLPRKSLAALRMHDALRVQFPNCAKKEQGGLGGAGGDRTPDLRIANATLSQLSYSPTEGVLVYWERRAAPIYS